MADVTAFAEKNEANFPILSDYDKTVSDNYGVLSSSGFARRWTFYIDPAGIIKKIDKRVSTSSAGPDLARHLQELGFDAADES